MNCKDYRENLRIGVDIGSTTVKLVIYDKEANEVLYRKYQRHNARQVSTLCDLLAETSQEYPEEKFQFTICGSGGKPVADTLGVHFVQEVVANAAVIQKFYPNARTAVELGGQDAKVIFFRYDETRKELSASDMRMNGSCAGGTGAFLDEMAALFQIKPNELEAYAEKGENVYEISGRCGVFAKTDIQPLLIQGADKHDIALSIFHAVAKQTIGGLSQGLELKAPIIFEGGPLTFNKTLVKVFAERLNLKPEEIIIPKNPETIVALGASIAADMLFEDNGECLTLLDAKNLLENSPKNTVDREAANPFFHTPEEREEFIERHRSELGTTTDLISKEENTENKVANVYIGIDSGSTTSKGVLIDEDENITDTFYFNNNGEPLEAVKKGLCGIAKKYEDAGITLNVLGVGTTGYGEMMLASALRADYHTVETVAHAAGCKKYIPDVSFILDIGGQDMKAIWMKDGVITDISLNEACSSGCGSFLENFGKSLNIPVKDIEKTAFSSNAPASLGSRCTVFMNSTIINEQRNGKETNDIMAGLCRSIIENVFTKVVRIANTQELGDKIVVQGGTFRNFAVLKALEEYLGKEVILAPFPGEIGALGAAISCKHQIEKDGYAKDGKSSFIGFDAIKNFTYRRESGVPCTRCQNHCSRTILYFGTGDTFITGNRCEKGTIISNNEEAKKRVEDKAKAIRKVPNLMRDRERWLFEEYPYKRVAEEKDETIGIPRTLEFWDSAPFWNVFFQSLGYNVKYSFPTNQKQFEKGLRYVASDTICFPAKVVHGHIHDLLQKGIKHIFMPYIMHMPAENKKEKSSYVCPVIMGYPMVVNNFQMSEKEDDVNFDTPIFHWFSEKDRKNQIINYAINELHATKKEASEAFAQARDTLKAFRKRLTDAAQAIIDDANQKGTYAVVLAGRPYHSDAFINHKLSRMFTKQGIPVLTVDSLPGLHQMNLHRSRAEITNDFHARMLGGAMVVASEPALEFVQIVSFGCGHDAILSDEIIRIVKEGANKSALILKVDESEASGSLGIRVQSFIETVNLRRERMNAKDSIQPLPDPYVAKFQKSDRKGRVLLVPNISAPIMKTLEGLLIKEGFEPRLLPVGEKEEILLGKRYTHNDICFPCQMIIGEIIKELQSGKYEDHSKVAVGMAKLNCDCRLANYTTILRSALDKAGFEDVPIITTDPSDTKEIHPGISVLGARTAVEAAWIYLMLDMLQNILRRIRPYELKKGESDRVFNECIANISQAAVNGLKSAINEFDHSIERMKEIEYDDSVRKPRALVTGELLVNFHPGTNFHIEEYLEEYGYETIFPRITNQFRKDFLANMCEIKEYKAKLVPYSFALNGAFNFIEKRLEKIAMKHPLYEKSVNPKDLYEEVSDIIPMTLTCGEGWLMAAEIVHYAKLGAKSFIILQPFGCLPNHVCGRGITKKIKDLYSDISILPLDLDPDTSYANIENRLQMLMMNEEK
jgi:predicted CoA-substrate-specific enzyme activase